MQWMVIKFRDGQKYFLSRVVQSRSAVWTTEKRFALRYSTEKAAEQIVKVAHLREVHIESAKPLALL